MRKSILLFTVILLSHVSVYAQYKLIPEELPETINESGDFTSWQPMISPDGLMLVYLIRDSVSVKPLWSRKVQGNWTRPIEIDMLSKLESPPQLFSGFDGQSLFFHTLGAPDPELKDHKHSIVVKSEFIDQKFSVPSKVDYLFGFSVVGNPSKLFETQGIQEHYELYFDDPESKKRLPDYLVGHGIKHVLPLGDNGVLFRKLKEERQLRGVDKRQRWPSGHRNDVWHSEIFMSVRENGQWSPAVKLQVEGLDESKIGKFSYSEASNELYFSYEKTRIFSAVLPLELSNLIIPSNQKENLKTASVKSNDLIENSSTIPARKSQYFALLIGIEDYQNNHANLVDLSNPISDAENLKTELLSNYTFGEENITVLKNPDRADIINSFEKISGQLSEKDNLLIFYAGHGVWDEKLNIGYWLASDATSSKANWISNSTIRDYIGGLNTKHTLLISDACFSGSIFKSREVTKSIDDYGFYRLNKLPSRKAMTSGTLKTVPDESKFMKYLLKALSTNEKEYFPSKQLFHEIEIAIINNTANVPQFGTIQNTGDEGGDFIFIKREKE